MNRFILENPYQSPTTVDLGVVSQTKHRSFRLTARTDDARDESTAGSISDAIRFTLIQQLPVLIFMSMVLDGGTLFKGAAVALIVFWAGVAMVLLRRGTNFSESDVLLIKWGYLPTCLISFNAWQIIARLF